MAFDPITAVADVFSSLIGLGKTYIDDKTKAAEFAQKVTELQIGFSTTLIETHTVPWVDALCKLLYVAKEFWRPVASTVLFFYGMTHPEVLKTMHNDLGSMGDVGIGGIFGSLPAWGVSRHIIESKKAESD